MSILSQKELYTIEQFCGENYSKRLRAIQERQKDKTVRIVNTGMVSSGKSSLYNALINSRDEFFPTGAARTTIKANYFDYNNISYIDTPGIDVRTEDDALAFDMLLESDIILMIHNIRTGPLNKSEAEWLDNITKRMSNIEMRKSKLIFVISWKDTREKDEDYAELVKNVKTQVFEIIGVEIPVFEVSIKKYQQGVEKGKNVLVQNSGILELKEYLEKYALQYLERKKELDDEEYRATIKEVRENLSVLSESRKKEKKIICDRIRNNEKSKKSAWRNVYDYFSAQRNKLSNLEQERNNI